jgi:hypothetical protein
MTIEEAATAVAAVPSPVLLFDTCALLDIIRAPLRGENHLIESAAILTRAATGTPAGIHVVITSTVEDEWTEHATIVTQEVDRELRRIRATSESFRAAARFAGLRRPPLLAAAYDLVPQRLFSVASLLHDSAVILERDLYCLDKAFARHAAKLPPARKGEQIKDCMIIEHFLSFCSRLRSIGCQAKCLFVSSNTSDYCEAKAKLHANLDSEFRAANLLFVTNLSWARHELALQ